ncbi:MAG: GNAT family N-acetyltransferase [Alphaproteobacteria bacterium]|nr:GNAT family N-acetyltransferase [Alphaproteobacteria bacterium]
MIADPVLRSAGLADAGLLATLHTDCFEDSWSTGAMIEVMRSPGTFGFLVELQPMMPVALALGRIAADEAELLTIGVARAWRRAGLARRLIRAVADEARGRGARRLFLEVAEDNTAARTLYGAESFQIVGRRRAYYTRPGGSAIDALTMRRDLARGWRWLIGR